MTKMSKLPLWPYYTVFLIYALISSFFVFLSSGLVIDNISYLHHFNNYVSAPIIFFYLAYIAIDNDKTKRNLFILVLICFIVLQLMMIIQENMTVQFFKISEHYEMAGRASGLMVSPNKTASLLVFLLPFYYYFYKHEHLNKILKYAFIVALFLIPYIVLYSGSRGAMLSLVFVLVPLIIIYKQFRLLGSLIFLLIISLPLFWDYLITDQFLYGYNRIFSSVGEYQGNDVASGRIDIWYSAYKLLIENPLNLIVGFGLGAYYYYFPYANTENFYLEVIMQLGMLGLILFVFFVSKFYKYIDYCKKNYSYHFSKLFLLSCISILVTFLSQNMSGLFNLNVLILGLGFAYMHNST
ncbi:MAG: O-antigen ligase family protein [bacterium]